MVSSPGQQEDHGLQQIVGMAAGAGVEQSLRPVRNGESQIVVGGPGDRMDEIRHDPRVDGRAAARAGQEVGETVRIRFGSLVGCLPVGPGQVHVRVRAFIRRRQEGVDPAQVALEGLAGEHPRQGVEPVPAPVVADGRGLRLHAVGEFGGPGRVTGDDGHLHEQGKHVR